jgi:hypothetical protein
LLFFLPVDITIFFVIFLTISHMKFTLRFSVFFLILIASIFVSKDTFAATQCIQQISYAVNPASDACQQFPSPCDIPAGWSQVSSCTNVQVSGKTMFAQNPGPMAGLGCSVPPGSTAQNGITISLKGNGYSQTVTSGDQNAANEGSFYFNNVHPATTPYKLCMTPSNQTKFQFYCAVGGSFGVECKDVTVGEANSPGNDIVMTAAGTCTPPPACVFTKQPCLIPEPAGGWCPVSPTPPTPINTIVPAPSNPPNPTGPSCSVRFTDVPQDSTFYQYIMCLGCRGVISGYSCGGAGEACNAQNDPYFRPNNPMTRGQMTKVVTNAAGFVEPIPSDRQTFTDVPINSTFWAFAERAVAHQLISGYTCGGAGEPCDAQSRPYLRVNSNITRGQGTKMITNAAQYNDAFSPTQQTFSDVAPNSTFWLYVERGFKHGIISGYACGGANEPCDSQNRPYFRPNGDLTRAQASKMVTVAFFPSCLVNPSISPPATCARKAEGDADCNGTINLLDFEIWRQEFTSTGEQPYLGKADFNHDGNTTLADFEIWRRTYTSQ